jgi:hypothetical protein
MRFGYRAIRHRAGWLVFFAREMDKSRNWRAFMNRWDLIKESEWCRKIGVCARTAVRWEKVGIVGPATYIARQRWRRADELPRTDERRLAR